MDGMGILNLLDTEYLDEFEYDSSYTISYSEPEEPRIEEPRTSKPNDRYTYRSQLEIMFPD
jgi:hypothetical protein